MNKKQRVLTVIALIAFAVIGAFHYLQWPPVGFYVWVSHTPTPEEKQKLEAAQSKWIDAWLERKDKEKAAEQSYQEKIAKYGKDAQFTDEEAGIWPKMPEEPEMPQKQDRVWHPSINFANGKYPPATIPDVRVPWFMLGVIYVGMFFLLADRKEKQGRKLDISRLDR